MAPRITRLEVTEFTVPRKNVEINRSRHGFAFEYKQGETIDRTFYAVKIHTDDGTTGEYVGRTHIGRHGEYLIGKNPLLRERHWTNRPGIRDYWGPADIALWDLAGKYYGAPVHELLGTYRTQLPAYASASKGDDNGGLDSPEAFADFAEECRDLGYSGFKHHSWFHTSQNRSTKRAIDREVATVHAIGNRVGDELDLMLDPGGEFETFADALRVGRACDEQGFLWYEDPYRDGLESHGGSRRLRNALDTPLMMTEKVTGLQSKTNFAVAEATDFLRMSHLEVDGGITGAIKAARMAEGFGLDIEYNAPGPAQRHCMAATRNSNYYEVGVVHPDWENIHYPPIYTDGYSDRLDAVDDGTVSVPDGKGLGVSYDWTAINEQMVTRDIYE